MAAEMKSDNEGRRGTIETWVFITIAMLILVMVALYLIYRYLGTVLQKPLF